MNEAQRVKFHFDEVHIGTPLQFGAYNLLQAGDLACEAGWRCGEHIQTAYEISFIESGQGTFIVNDKAYPVEKNMIFINKLEERHELITSPDKPMRYFYLGFTFSDEGLSRYEHRVLEEFFMDPENRMIRTTAKMQELFYRLFNNLMMKDVFSSLLIEYCIHALVVETYRIFNNMERSYSPTSVKEGKRRLVYDIANYIEQELPNLDSLRKIGDEFGYSYSYLADIFYQSMGETMTKYFTRKRFEWAVQMLGDGVTVTRIAESLGYKSIFSFSRAFTQYYGMSPTEYKKQYLMKDDSDGKRR